jgi:hypothetical protein
MSTLNRLMSRGVVPPQVHGVLDYPLAAILIAGPLVLDFNDTAATVIALVFGAGAAVLAIGTAWQTGIVKVIPPILHGYADIIVTIALVVLAFALGLEDHTAAFVFYLVVGAGGLLVTLETRFPPLAATTAPAMTPPEPA